MIGRLPGRPRRDPRAVLQGWTDFHWRHYVLVGTAPDGRRYSMGEIVQLGRTAAIALDQRISFVSLLGPDGKQIEHLQPHRLRDALREARAAIQGFGGRMRHTVDADPDDDPSWSHRA